MDKYVKLPTINTDIIDKKTPTDTSSYKEVNNETKLIKSFRVPPKEYVSEEEQLFMKVMEAHKNIQSYVYINVSPKNLYYIHNKIGELSYPFYYEITGE